MYNPYPPQPFCPQPPSPGWRGVRCISCTVQSSSLHMFVDFLDNLASGHLFICSWISFDGLQLHVFGLCEQQWYTAGSLRRSGKLRCEQPWQTRSQSNVSQCISCLCVSRVCTYRHKHTHIIMMYVYLHIYIFLTPQSLFALRVLTSC